MLSSIKRIAPLLAFIILAHSATAEGDFSRTLTPEELRVTGLLKLTPEEFAQLEAVVERYKAGGPAAAPVAVAPQTAVPPVRQTKILPSWVGALITLERVGKQPDKSDAMESRLTGRFTGWSGRTSFKLENGQLWIQTNSDSYAYTPALESPKVRIYPASFGTYWLEIEGTHQRCRVKPVNLQ